MTPKEQESRILTKNWKEVPQITQMQALDYEARQSSWVDKIGWNWLQEIASIYLAIKVKRKWSRYIVSRTIAKELGRIE